jgi:TldD protein
VLVQFIYRWFLQMIDFSDKGRWKAVLSRELERIAAQAGGVDYADARIAASRSGVAGVSRGEKTFEAGESEGIAFRVLFNGAWGYASSSSVSKEDAADCAKRALKAARATGNGRGTAKIKLADADFFEGDAELLCKKSALDADGEELLKISGEQYDRARGFGKKIADCKTALSFGRGILVFANSEGIAASRTIERTRFFTFVVAREGSVQREYVKSDGIVGGLELLGGSKWQEHTDAACTRAVELLSSVKTPLGPMPVVFRGSGGGTGLIAHEAVGHAVEGDYAASDRSFFNGKIGKEVASEEVSLIDDGSAGSGFGAIVFDDEGVVARKARLIDKGIFKTFLLDRQSAAHFGLEPTGNARAQDQNRRVYVRMRNTYIEPGKWDAEEIVRDTKRGILCNHWKAGIEDPAGGSFQLFFTDGYLVENGELTKSLYNISVSQPAALDALKNVDAIGKDLSMDAGGCGKGHADYVSVGSGGPTMRIKSLIVGGA